MKKPSFKEEKRIWEKGYRFVIGVDEVGRGSFAGPVVAGAVVYNKDTPCQPRTRRILEEINDSKLLKAEKREELSRVIKNQAQLYAIATIGVSTINKLGVGKASQMAIRKAIKMAIRQIVEMKRSKPPIFVLADGFHTKYIKWVGLVNQRAIIKGDQKSVSIASASIIAKVYRDRLMRKLNQKYPGYGFAANKGYGTKLHQLALRKYGLTEIHRTSFNLRKFLSL